MIIYIVWKFFNHANLLDLMAVIYNNGNIRIFVCMYTICNFYRNKQLYKCEIIQ